MIGDRQEKTQYCVHSEMKLPCSGFADICREYYKEEECTNFDSAMPYVNRETSIIFHRSNSIPTEVGFLYGNSGL